MSVVVAYRGKNGTLLCADKRAVQYSDFGSAVNDTFNKIRHIDEIGYFAAIGSAAIFELFLARLEENRAKLDNESIQTFDVILDSFETSYLTMLGFASESRVRLSEEEINQLHKTRICFVDEVFGNIFIIGVDPPVKFIEHYVALTPSNSILLDVKAMDKNPELAQTIIEQYIRQISEQHDNVSAASDCIFVLTN